jgi:hypothetical protein
MKIYALLNVCACGCGKPTTIFRGKPRRFVKGHGRRKHPHDEPVRLRRRRQRYGLEAGDIDRMLKNQGNQCGNPGCGKTIDWTADIDHDHVTGAIRGLLCGPCNRAAGLARDNPTVLRGLADYLEA